MFRLPSLAALCLCFALISTCDPSAAEARRWGSYSSYSAYYGPGYFHSYHNYGGRYRYRPSRTYIHSYGSPYYGAGWGGYYGGWSTYAPYAYSPFYYTSASYGLSAPSYSYVGYTSPYAYGSYAAPNSYVSYSTPSVYSVSYAPATVVTPVVTTTAASTCDTCAPTCCDSWSYTPATFSSGWCGPDCGTSYVVYSGRRGCGLLGGLCPFRNRGWWGASTYGTYGYGGCCGW